MRNKEQNEGEWPEAYVPYDVLDSLDDNVNLTDDLSLLKLGYRISPIGIRTMLFAACNGFVTDQGYTLPFNGFFERVSALSYGYFSDLFNKEEFDLLMAGKKINNRLAQSDSDIYQPQVYQALGNKILPSIEEVAIDIERRRKVNPKIRVILMHGTWNGIPHIGHATLPHDLCGTVNMHHNIDYNDMVMVASCDTNSFIQASGKKPFLNTLWRSSLMSYLPSVDYVTTSGDIDSRSYGRKTDLHWLHKYKILRPDFVNVDASSPRVDEICFRAKQCGIEPITMDRISEWIPKPGNPKAKRIENHVSSSRIKDGSVDFKAFEREFYRLLNLKQMWNNKYGERNLYQPNNLLYLDKPRGFYPPSPIYTHKVSFQQILVPESPIPTNERLLQEAFDNI